MTAQRFRYKPEKQDQDRGIVAAQYHAGQPLDDLQAVADHTGPNWGDKRYPVLAECTLPDETVLVVRWLQVLDERLPEEKYEIVGDGNWLYYSEYYRFLDSDTTRSIEHRYEPVTP